MCPEEILKQYFGYASFREGQKEIIDAILENRDALAIMPTGAGKSVCYQVPALLLPGITVVISPLISLMQDQVKALNAAGIHAAYVNSSLTETQVQRALNLAAMGAYKIVYVAPERLESFYFRQFAEAADISQVCVDEAHCISQWGQDFRPSYLKIVDFIRTLQKRPVISAFTATATKEVREDIRCILGLTDPEVVITSFDRPNLYYEVLQVKKKDNFILDYVEKHKEESGIIYCATRKNVDNLFELLFKAGYSVAKYHAGLPNEMRKSAQDDFVYDRTSVMVATNAFGMGIDKSNVRYVIHYNMPQSMENYYQEAGRAGRDGEDSRCILLFSLQDVMIDKMLLEHKDFSAVDPADVENIRMRDQQRLRIMENYCETTECLRNYILQYFGEQTAGPCGNCANCEGSFEEIDMTEAAKWIINCTAETHGRFGTNIVTGTLVGANRARLREIGAVNYRSYGVLRGTDEETLKDLITQMVQKEYLILTTGRYSVLQMGPHAMDLKDETIRVTLKSRREEPDAYQDEVYEGGFDENVAYDPAAGRSYGRRHGRAGSRRSASMTRRTDDLTSLGFQLFEELRTLRVEIARTHNLPPYIVFTDKTLIDMCLKLPGNKEEMLNVSGVAQAKFEKYGEEFLYKIIDFVDAHPGQTISEYVPAQTAAEPAAVQPEKKKPAKKKKTKVDFYLTSEEAAAFSYKEICSGNEIRDELNACNHKPDVKTIPTTWITAYMKEAGLVEDRSNGRFLTTVPSEEGERAGITTIEQISAKGNTYEVLQYPEKIQRMIVAHFTKEASGDL